MTLRRILYAFTKTVFPLWIVDEDIRDYYDCKFDVSHVQVGRVLGNVDDNPNPKQTGYWTAKDVMWDWDLEKVTTELPKK